VEDGLDGNGRRRVQRRYEYLTGYIAAETASVVRYVLAASARLLKGSSGKLAITRFGVPTVPCQSGYSGDPHRELDNARARPARLKGREGVGAVRGELSQQ